MQRLILAVFILLITSCIPYSDNPLSDPSTEPLDPSVIGTWFWNEDNDHGFLHIGIDADGKTLLLTMVEYKSDGRVETSEFKGHTSTLSSRRFLNLKWVKPKDLDKGYLLVKYEVNADTLTCSMPDLSTLEKAVKSGSLKGEALSSGDILIHAGQSELRKYVSKNEATLFQYSSKLRKLTLPQTVTQEGNTNKTKSP